MLKYNEHTEPTEKEENIDGAEIWEIPSEPENWLCGLLYCQLYNTSIMS